MLSSWINIPLTRLVTKGITEQVRHLPASRQRLLITGIAHVGDQSDKVIFVCPDIPFGPAFVFGVGSQVAIPELAFDQFGDGVIEFFAQFRGAGVDPG